MNITPGLSTLHPRASPERKTHAVGILCGIVVIVLFSGFTLVSRLGFSLSLTLPDIAALRFGIGGTLLLPVLLRYGLAGLRWRDAAALAFLGGIGFALFAYAGLSLAPASHGAVLLHGTLPLFTFAIVRVTSGSKAKGAHALGLSMIALGVAAMAWDSVAGATWRQLIGDVSLLLASILWSAYGVLARRLVGSACGRCTPPQSSPCFQCTVLFQSTWRVPGRHYFW